MHHGRVAAAAARPASSYWTHGASIYTNAWVSGGAVPGPDEGELAAEAVELQINGVSWSGFESKPCVLGWLEKHDARDFLKQLSETMGFNALRIPFSANALVSALQPPICSEDRMLAGHNPRYRKLSYIEQLALLIRDAGDVGMLVMLDLHRLHEGRKGKPSGSLDELELMERAWEMVGRELCDADKYWNFFAADLRNEPYAAHWGEPNDWERGRCA